MIKVKIYKNSSGKIYGFDINNHGEKIVCAAVSILTLNTVNCIEHFTKDKFECDYDERGGRLEFRIPSGIDGNNSGISHDATLLVNAMVFGLYGIRKQYGRSLEIIETEALL